MTEAHVSFEITDGSMLIHVNGIRFVFRCKFRKFCDSNLGFFSVVETNERSIKGNSFVCVFDCFSCFDKENVSF